VSPETFEQMVAALEAAEAGKTKPGRPSELSLADQVLLMLQYHYDYDTQARLGVAFGLSESAVSYLIRRVEARLLSDARFHLPARRARLVHDTPAVAVDASETPIERPKKNSTATTAASARATRSRAN
jgi:DNA-binding MarR family transcriptional regulator